MDQKRNLLITLGEWWEQRKLQHTEKASPSLIISPHRYFWFPTPGNVIFILLVIGGLLWVQNVGAITLSAPGAAAISTGTIAYQGRLANSSGQPLTQTVNMVFRLYAAASGGTPLWEEQWTGSNSVQASDGLFNVMLGSLTPIPQMVITGNSNLFLGITVGTDSEMSPRVQLGSVPFATQALTVPDGSITKAKLAADVSLVPPDGSITTAKLANSSVTSSKLARKMTKVVSTGDMPLPNANTAYDVLSATLNLDQDTLVTINASAGLQNSSTDGLLYAWVEVDGNSIITSHNWQKAGYGEHHMLSTSLILNAGQHVVKLRAGSWMNNSLVNGDNRTQMVIIEG